MRKALLGALVLAAAAGAFLFLGPKAPAPEPQDGDAPPESAAAGLAAGASPRPTTDAPANALRFLGRVVDPAGRPVAQAAVTVREIVPRSFPVPRRGGSASIVTAADGTFAARLPAESGVADVVASAAGYATASVERAMPDRPVEVRLRAEGVLLGRVVDEDRTPIAGASVHLFRVLAHDHLETVEATSAADGTFRVGGFGGPPESKEKEESRTGALLDVRATGFGGIQRPDPRPYAGETLRADFLLLRSDVLEVLVTDADSKAPIPGARVNAGWAGWPFWGAEGTPIPHPAPFLDQQTTDEGGRCRLQGVPRRLSPDQVLYVRGGRSGFCRGQIRVSPRADPSEPVALSLWPAAPVRGRVVDATGAPVPSVRVYSEPRGWAWPAPEEGAWQDGTPTDDEGRYLLPAVQASAAGTAITSISTSGRRGVLPDGRVFYSLEDVRVEVQPRTGQETIAPNLVLEVPRPTTSARIVVVDRQGRPVPGARVSGGLEVGWTYGEGRTNLRWVIPPASWSEKDLRYEVAVVADGFARAIVACRPQVLEPPEVRVTLSEGLRLEGRVEYADGTAVAGAFVHAGPKGLGGSDVRSTHDGSFSLRDLAAEAFRVEAVSAAGEVGAIEEAVAGQAPVVVVLGRNPGATLVATLVAEEDGSALVDGSVGVSFNGFASPLNPKPREDPGVQVLPSVPPGTWTVRGSAPGRLDVSTSATFVDGQTVRVRLALPRGTPAVLRLRAPDAVRKAIREDRGGGLALFHVDAAADVGTDGLGARRWAYPDEEFTVRFDALPAGKHRLVWENRARSGPTEKPPPRRPYVSRSAVVVGPARGSPVDVEVELVPAGILWLVIEDHEVPESFAQPHPPPAGTIEVVGGDGERHALAPWWARGANQVSLLPGGYTARVRFPSGRTAERDVEIRAGEGTTVTLGDGQRAPK